MTKQQKEREDNLRREAFHRMLDLALDINEMQASQRRFTEGHPTALFYIFQRRADEFMEKSPRLSKPRVSPRTKHTEMIMERTSISPAGMARSVYRGGGGVSDGMRPEIEELFHKYFGQQVELALRKKKKGGS